MIKRDPLITKSRVCNLMLSFQIISTTHSSAYSHQCFFVSPLFRFLPVQIVQFNVKVHISSQWETFFQSRLLKTTRPLYQYMRLKLFSRTRQKVVITMD